MKLFGKRVIAFMMAFLLAGGIPASYSGSADTPTPVNVNNLTLHGRTYVRSGVLYLYWTYSGFTCKINGTGLTATLLAENMSVPSQQAYLSVYVDGAPEPVNVLHLNSSSATYTLVDNLTPGEHTITVRKRNEAASSTIGVKTLDVIGGQFLAPPAKASRTIEFVGDSITCGFGNMIPSAASGPDHFSTETEDGCLTYATLVAQALGAEATIVAQSGINFVRIKDNNFNPYYEKTAAVIEKTGSADPWDFASHPQDVVVINLGTNDNGATKDDEYMTAEAVNFLKLVRKNNPNALIVWAYGMMGDSRRAALEAAVNQVRAEGDQKVFYYNIDPMITSTEGVGLGHPTIQTHILRSIGLAEFIAEKTGWDCDIRVALDAQIQLSKHYTNPEKAALYTPETMQKLTASVEAAQQLPANATREQINGAIQDIFLRIQKLLLLTDISDEYIVVDTCDTKGFWSGYVDYEEKKQGAASLFTRGSGFLAINRHNPSGPIGIELPPDWRDWYLEMWLYTDAPKTFPTGSCIELSQVVDQIEVQWDIANMSLQPGWNKIMLKLGSGSVSQGENFKTLNNIRIWRLEGANTLMTLRVDDIVLSKGKAAANTQALEEKMALAEPLLSQEDQYTSESFAVLRAAYEAARQAESQRDVDVAVENLTAAMEGLTQYHLGDVDGNGKVNTTDARMTLQAAVGKITLTEAQTQAADVDKSGKVTATDARKILQYAVGKIEDLEK